MNEFRLIREALDRMLHPAVVYESRWAAIEAMLAPQACVDEIVATMLRNADLAYYPPFTQSEPITMRMPDPNIFPGAKFKITRTWTCCDACTRYHRTLLAARLHSWIIRARAATWRHAPLWLVTLWLKLQLFLYAVANPRKR